MTESRGADLLRSDDFANGVPVVLVMHVQDPRFLQCRVDARAECQGAWVVDRVVWAGQPVDLRLPDDPYSPMPRLTIADVEAAIGSHDVIAAAVVVARDVSWVDPRLHEVGGDLVWVVRSLAQAGAAGHDATREVKVWMVSDASGQVDASLDLALDSSEGFGSFLSQALAHRVDTNDDEPLLYRVERLDGTAVLEGHIGGWWSSNQDNVERLLAAAPDLLEPGDYLVRAWRGRTESFGIVWDAPKDECSVQITIVAGQQTRLEAEFPKSGSCTWHEPTFSDTLD